MSLLQNYHPPMADFRDTDISEIDKFSTTESTE